MRSLPTTVRSFGFVASLVAFAVACGDEGATPGGGSGAESGAGPTGGTASGAPGTSPGGSSGSNAGGAGASGGSSASGGIAGGGASGGVGNSGGAGGGSGSGTAGDGGGGAAAGGASGGGSGGNGGAGSGAGGAGSGSGGAGSGGTSGNAGKAGGGAGGAGAGGGGSGGGGSGGNGGADPNLPAGLTDRFPRGNATGVCTDAALRLDFAQAVTLGATGRIQIFAASGGAAVDTIDMSVMRITDTIGGRTYNLLRPVFVDGNQAVAYFHQRRLMPNTQYYVTVDAGVFNSGSFQGITSNTAWRFTTGPAAAASASMSVGAKGGANFCTVQGALDAIPASNTNPVTVTVGAGIYHEIVYMNGKRNVTLRGADRAGTVITYPNNDMLNAGTSGRPMMFVNGANGFVLETMTLRNTTPQGGSQAEALRVSGDQMIVRNANLVSLQDTLLSNGRLYVSNSSIEGNVDYIWGGGPAYFDRCEIKTVGRSGYGVQSRNDTGYGYVFVDSRLTSDSGITGHVLARIDADDYPNSHVAFINCQMGTHVSAAGWTVTGSNTASLRFWEYQSTTLTGGALSVSGRHAASRQLSASEAAMMRDKATVLGGWDPAP